MLTLTNRKKIRAKIIADYVARAGYQGVVIFTCGNAARALRECDVDVLEIGPNGVLIPPLWWKPADIRRTWPHLFDATSGHLPMPLMIQLAESLRDHIGPLSQSSYDVPTGSGETITCLRWAYPVVSFTPVYNQSASTRREDFAPLNYVVDGYPEGPTIIGYPMPETGATEE